jgi:hypothetical protein
MVATVARERCANEGESPRNAVGGKVIFILQIRLKHLLEGETVLFVAHFEDADPFEASAGDSLRTQHEKKAKYFDQILHRIPTQKKEKSDYTGGSNF